MDRQSIVADGRDRAAKALRAQQAEVRKRKGREIRVQVWRKYRAAITQASPFKRFLLGVQMRREISRRLRMMEREFDQEVADIASDYALFLTPGQPGRSKPVSRKKIGKH